MSASDRLIRTGAIVQAVWRDIWSSVFWSRGWVTASVSSLSTRKRGIIRCRRASASGIKREDRGPDVDLVEAHDGEVVEGAHEAGEVLFPDEALFEKDLARPFPRKDGFGHGFEEVVDQFLGHEPLGDEHVSKPGCDVFSGRHRLIQV